jgi:hypothetical protein
MLEKIQFPSFGGYGPTLLHWSFYRISNKKNCVRYDQNDIKIVETVCRRKAERKNTEWTNTEAGKCILNKNIVDLIKLNKY